MKCLKDIYPQDPEGTKKLSENNFVLKYKGRTFNLTLSKQGDTLIPELSEELKVRKIKLYDVRSHILFKDCNTMEDIEKKFKQYIINGKVNIVEDHSQYHIVLCKDVSVGEGVSSGDNEKGIVKEILTAQNFIKNKLGKLYESLQENLKKASHYYNDKLRKFKEDINSLQAMLSQFSAEGMNIKETINKVEKLIASRFREVKGDTKNTQFKDVLINKMRGQLKGFKPIDFKINLKNINTILRLQNGLIATANQQGMQILDINKLEIKSVMRYNEINKLILLNNGDLVSSSEHFDCILNKPRTTVDFWKLQNGKFNIKKIYQTDEPINCLASLKQGKFAAGEYELIALFDFNEKHKTYDKAKTFKAHDGDVLTIVQLQDSYFASGSNDETIKLWDYTGRCVLVLKNFGSVFPFLVLSDGKLVVGKNCKAIKIWEPSQIGGYNCSMEITNFQSDITALASFSCYFIISGHQNGSIKIWDITGGYTCINTLMGHSSPVTSIIAFNGDRLVSSCTDIKLWK
jgi:hypothetical protein